MAVDVSPDDVSGHTLGMVTTDPQGVAWSVELRGSGRVCLDIRRWRTWAYVFVAGYMTLIALGLLILVRGVGGILVGAGLLLLAVPMTVSTLRQGLRLGSWASPVVVVDAAGVTARHGVLSVPWDELCGAIAYSASHNRWIALVVTDEFYDRWFASLSWPMRILGRGGRRRAGTTINLPPNLAVDTDAFAAWLTEEIFDRLRAQL